MRGSVRSGVSREQLMTPGLIASTTVPGSVVVSVVMAQVSCDGTQRRIGAVPHPTCGKLPTMRVTICDVGPRDGLQNEPERLAPQLRAELVNRLARAGLPRIEAVSFVRDDRVPQLAGAEEVVAGIERRAGTEYSGLVLNERGYERFHAVGLDRVN